MQAAESVCIVEALITKKNINNNNYIWFLDLSSQEKFKPCMKSGTNSQWERIPN